ncbi:TRAP-type C4-dicarboxylate transport system, small permease component [Paracoccus tibetensis]|uniref:TRAP transporter small permease protein n=1 Tax=Paracoccus tibetensis TaxID=336292 RepID=A0A1G5HNP1_9RHOB|nr:TRAP-type C4-dicarboxylate transport system, small permease component [Paracoccus tibetensis]
MTAPVRAVLRLWSCVEAVAEAAIVLLTVAMVAAAAAQIVARYAFAAPLAWSEELSRYLFVWLAFLAAWLAWRRREHISLDMLPGRVRPATVRLAELLVLAFAVVAMTKGMRLMGLSARQPSAALGLPMVWVYAGFYAGMGMVAGDILTGWLRAFDRRGSGTAPQSGPGAAT